MPAAEATEWMPAAEWMPEAPGAVLALFESTSNGIATVREAANAADRRGTPLVVVTLAGQHGKARCCGGPSPLAYNCAVRDAAHESLLQARELLAGSTVPAMFAVLTGAPEPPLAAWVVDREFADVFVPRHRLAPRGHWAARALRRCPAADVHVVG
jgi:hypothetical protein